MLAVSETALITASCRALEHARPEACLRDPYAAQLAGERGAFLLRELMSPELVANGCIVRTHLIDRLVLDHITGCDLVVNLGAGLDSRAYRLALPSHLRWVEIDHAELLEYKANKLAGVSARCQLQSIALDLSDSTSRSHVLRDVGRDSEHALVLSEGVLSYLPDSDVVALARDLQEALPGCVWLTDLVSAAALRSMPTEIVAGDRSAELRFAPASGPGFFERCGWRVLAQHSCLRESRALGRAFIREDLAQAARAPESRHVFEKLFRVVELASPPKRTQRKEET